MREYKVTDFRCEAEFKDAVLSDGNLTDIEKLSLIFSVSKESLKTSDVQLYYAILAVLDKNKKIVIPPDYFNSDNK